eukprot:1760625-Rhodomonas_salina.1
MSQRQLGRLHGKVERLNLELNEWRFPSGGIVEQGRSAVLGYLLGMYEEKLERYKHKVLPRSPCTDYAPTRQAPTRRRLLHVGATHRRLLLTAERPTRSVVLRWGMGVPGARERQGAAHTA